jgi:hypothetical protein
MKMVRGAQCVGTSIEGQFTQKYHLHQGSVAKVIRENWNTASLFISLSFRYNVKEYLTEYYVDRLFFDLDSKKGSLNDSFYDLSKLQTYAERMGTDCYGFLSNTGVHAHFIVEPFWTPNPQEVTEIKAKMANYLNLKTADWQAFSLAKMPRIPNSVTKNGYAVVILPEEYPENTIERAKSRQKFPGLNRKRQVNFTLLVKDLKEVSSFKKSGTFVCQNGEFDEENPVSEIFSKPCIRVHLSRHDAPAYIRWLATVHLKKKGFTIQDTVDFFSTLHWDDWNPGKTLYMVEKAYTYSFAASCAKIGSNALCIGEECPYWRNRTGFD